MGEYLTTVTTPSKGEFSVKMFSLGDFIEAQTKYDGKTFELVAYLSAKSIGVKVEDFLKWDYLDTSPIIDIISQALSGHQKYYNKETK